MRNLIILCLLFFASLAYGKTINQYSPKEQIIITGALVKQKQYQDAIDIIDEVENLSPQLLMIKAQALKGLKRNDQAIATYQTVLAVRPSAQAARLQMAQLLEQSGDLNKSQKHYRLLFDEISSGTMGIYLEQKIASLNKRLSNHYIKLNLRSFYDANINKAPNQGNISIGNYVFNFDEPIEAYMLAPEIELGYQKQLSSKLIWHSFAKAAIEASVWSSEDIGSEYDRAYAQASTGLSYAITPKSRILAFINGSLELKDYEYDNHNLGGTISYQQSIGKFHGYAKYGYQYQAYDFKPLTSNSHQATLGVLYNRSANEQYGLSVSYIDSDAKSDLFSYNAPYASVSWSKEYDNGFNISASSWVKYAQYEQFSNLFQNTREDLTLGSSVSIDHDSLKIWGFKPKFTYVFEQVESNQEVYSQMKHQVHLDYEYVF